jgi:DNA modification methylase
VLPLKPKDIIGIPWRVAFALQADGWWLRQDIIWHKPNPMPESVTDRCTKAHEYLFLLSKSATYRYDAAAIAEAGLGGGKFNGSPSYAAGDRNDAGRRDFAEAATRNKRSVWTVATQPFSEAHFATFPPALIEPCILAGCPAGGTVLDPFGGAGTTGLVADRLGRNAILIELNPEYAAMAQKRIGADAGMFASVEAA